jgi:hypothetical protein
LHDTSYPDAYILCKMRLELASSVAEEWATNLLNASQTLCTLYATLASDRMACDFQTMWEVKIQIAWTYQGDDVSHWFWHRSEPSRDCESDLICIDIFDIECSLHVCFKSSACVWYGAVVSKMHDIIFFRPSPLSFRQVDQHALACCILLMN